MGNSSGSIERKANAAVNALSIKRLNLAPSTQIGDDGHECPICFLNYSHLNDVDCCHQVVCTDCYVKLSSVKGATCPFCSTVTFKVSYKNSASITLQSKDDSYIRPSSKALTKAEIAETIDNIKATVTDRKDIEKEMRSQRANSSADPYFSHPSPPLKSSPISRANSLPANRFQSQMRPQFVHYSHGFNPRAHSQQQLPGHQQPVMRSLRDIEENLARGGFFEEIVPMSAYLDEASLAEELMMMEAIRLSLEEQAVSETKSNEINESKEADFAASSVTEDVKGIQFGDSVSTSFLSDGFSTRRSTPDKEDNATVLVPVGDELCNNDDVNSHSTLSEINLSGKPAEVGEKLERPRESVDGTDGAQIALDDDFGEFQFVPPPPPNGK